MVIKTLRYSFKKEEESVNYKCGATGIVKEGQFFRKGTFRMKRQLRNGDQSATYCCAAADMLLAEQLPPEDAY